MNGPSIKLRALLAVLAVAIAPSIAAQLKGIPAQFHGKWVPANAGCESSLSVAVSAGRLVLANGKDTEAIGGIEMAGPGFFAPGYRGIQVVALTEVSGHQPVTATFNAGEKKGAGLIEYAPIMPSTKPNPAQKAYNARISKLNLAKRFPLNNAPLKKCAR